LIDKEEGKKTLPSGAQLVCIQGRMEHSSETWYGARGAKLKFLFGKLEGSGEKRCTKKKVWTAAAAGVGAKSS